MIQGKFASESQPPVVDPDVLTKSRVSVNCRLPQTPRTPSVGMSHYFDEILHRHVNPGGAGSQTPRSSQGPGPGHLRRSSTARSLGARSDFDSNDLNGFDDEADGDFPARRGSSLSLAMSSVHGDRSSVMLGDPARLQERREADAHMHNYVAEQLERVRTERGTNGYSGGDEFEAQASE